MAGAVCHEMNQPLQVVAGLSDLIRMTVKEENPLFDNLIKIKEQTNRMGEMTNKLKKVSKYKTKGYLEGKTIDIDKATL
jgi:C4-dicarboxylate-specific signal transduction histidine kinase